VPTGVDGIETVAVTYPPTQPWPIVPTRRRLSRLLIIGLAAAALLACGGGILVNSLLTGTEKTNSAESTSKAAPNGPSDNAAIDEAAVPVPQPAAAASPTMAAPKPTPTTTEPKEPPKPRTTTEAPPPKPKPACDSNYAGACVPIASDVDCAGGGGNGPAYVVGPVRVVGLDVYDLDRDGDGIGCDT
jgi:hypothetical protein